MNDSLFRRRLKQSMLNWQEVRERGLAAMAWLEILVKSGITLLAIDKSK